MNDLCKRVVLSSKAYLSIVAEAYEKFNTETGGILLGRRNQRTWYVIEVLDPGPNSIFRPSYFEYDTPYVNHLANKVARVYKERLELVGLWHRHPGSFDSFSSTDDETNRDYASQNEAGVISGLVNLDPHLRITLYHVTLPLSYRKVSVEIGDHLIPSNYLSYKIADDFVRTKTVGVSTYTSSERYGQTNKDQGKVVAITSVPAPGANGQRRSRGVANFLKAIYTNVFTRKSDYGETNKDQKEGSISSPITDTSVPASGSTASAKVKPGSIQEVLLEMLDGEMDYLESQREYEYKVSLKDDFLSLSLTRVSYITYGPQHLACKLTVKNGKRVVDINGVEQDYDPGAIRRFIETRNRPGMTGQLFSHYE